MQRMTGSRSTFALAPLVLMMLVPLAACAQQQQPSPTQSDPGGATPAGEEAPSMLMFIGTYTGEKSKSRGIYAVRLDTKTGALSEPVLAGETKSPSFLALHPTRRFLYAACEVWDAGGKGSGVGAFAVDAAAGKLSPLNHEPSGGGGPCYVAVDPAGKVVVVANYGGGTVASLPIEPDGKLRPAASVIQHEGKGPNERRQEKAHAHSINLDPTGKYALACDLGTDEVRIYRLDPTKGMLTSNDPSAAKAAPGAGPRHLAFHPNGKFAFVINELNSTLTSYAWDGSRGTLSEVQTIGTLPDSFAGGGNTTAEVAVHPSGKFVYGSNRGHDSIAIFAVDPSTGRLTARGHEGTRGKTPRHFAIDPSGAFLVAANQGSDNLVVYRIDQNTGALSATGATATVGSPVCVRFVPNAR
jgi:6-phosphogluconolactonase